MRIFSHIIEQECDVYVVVIRADADVESRKNIIFYVSERGKYGLWATSLVDADVVDWDLGPDYRFYYNEDREIKVIYWSYFRGMDHIDQLMDNNLDVVADFERARNSIRWRLKLYLIRIIKFIL